METKTTEYFEHLEPAWDDLSNGERLAFYAWEHRENGIPVIKGMGLFASYIPDCVATLRESGQSKCILLDQSTEVMPIIHAMVECGCTIIGTCTAGEVDPIHKWDRLETKSHMALEFKL